MSAFEAKMYKWRDGFSYKKDPSIVGKVLERIEERDGEVTAESFLDESRPEESETHDMFEWNDSVAAEKYRLSQSRCIIAQLSFDVVVVPSRVIEIEIMKEAPKEETFGEKKFVRSAFINVNPKGTPKGKARYVRMETAMRNDEMRNQVIRNVLFELEMYANKHSQIEELAELFQTMTSKIQILKEKYA